MTKSSPQAMQTVCIVN